MVVCRRQPAGMKVLLSGATKRKMGEGAGRCRTLSPKKKTMRRTHINSRMTADILLLSANMTMVAATAAMIRIKK